MKNEIRIFVVLLGLIVCISCDTPSDELTTYNIDVLDIGEDWNENGSIGENGWGETGSTYNIDGERLIIPNELSPKNQTNITEDGWEEELISNPQIMNQSASDVGSSKWDDSE